MIQLRYPKSYESSSPPRNGFSPRRCRNGPTNIWFETGLTECCSKLPDSGKKLFFTLRDLTNASKHWKLDSKGESKRIVSGVSGPEIADWYSYFIAGPVIYVLVNGARPSLPELAELTLECLDWILQGEGPFPPSLVEKLETAFRPL